MEVCLQTSIFAPLFKRKHISLDYGVMVAQQVLVLFVQVRILVVQLKESLGREIFQGFLFNIIILIDLFLYYFLLKNFHFLPFEQYYYIIGTKTQ